MGRVAPVTIKVGSVGKVSLTRAVLPGRLYHRGKHEDGPKISPPSHLDQKIVPMTVRVSLVLLASLLIVSVLATLSSTAEAYALDPSVEAALSSSRMMSAGPLNVIVFETQAR